VQYFKNSKIQNIITSRISKGLADPSVFISALEEPTCSSLGVVLRGVLVVMDPRCSLELLLEPTPINLNNHLQQQLKYADIVLIRNDMSTNEQQSPHGNLRNKISLLEEEIMKRKHVNTRILVVGSEALNLEVLLPPPPLPPSPIFTTVAQEIKALPNISSRSNLLNMSGFGGGISSGFLAPSLTAHDKRLAYITTCIF
jgi:hypothetical protein